MKRLLRIAVAALGITAVSGCAITSSHHSGPNGRPVHWIDGMSASAAYSKAGNLCPYGYTILGDPRQTSILDYEMTVECKASAPEPVATLAPAAYSAPVQATVATSKEQQLQELQSTPGLNYEEYMRRYRIIMGQ